MRKKPVETHKKQLNEIILWTKQKPQYFDVLNIGRMREKKLVQINVCMQKTKKKTGLNGTKKINERFRDCVECIQGRV